MNIVQAYRWLFGAPTPTEPPRGIDSRGMFYERASDGRRFYFGDARGPHEGHRRAIRLMLLAPKSVAPPKGCKGWIVKGRLHLKDRWTDTYYPVAPETPAAYLATVERIRANRAAMLETSPPDRITP